MKRITRRIEGTNTIEFVDGKGYGNLTHEETVKLLFSKLADCEDAMEKQKDPLRAYFPVEDFLYLDAGKSKPLEIQAAMVWGALGVVHRLDVIDWDEMRNMFGEFMSKKLNLR